MRHGFNGRFLRLEIQAVRRGLRFGRDGLVGCGFHLGETRRGEIECLFGGGRGFGRSFDRSFGRSGGLRRGRQHRSEFVADRGRRRDGGRRCGRRMDGAFEFRRSDRSLDGRGRHGAFDGFRGRGRSGAFTRNQTLDCFDQVLGFERFGDDLRTPGGQGSIPIEGLERPGHQHDGQMKAGGIALDRLTDGIPVGAGHDRVADDDVRAARGEFFQQLVAARRGDDLEIGIGKGQFDDFLDRQTVIGEQDGFAH